MFHFHFIQLKSCKWFKYAVWRRRKVEDEKKNAAVAAAAVAAQVVVYGQLDI